MVIDWYLEGTNLVPKFLFLYHVVVRLRTLDPNGGQDKYLCDDLHPLVIKFQQARHPNYHNLPHSPTPGDFLSLFGCEPPS